MDHSGKRVAICSANKAFARALAILLDDFEVSQAERLEEIPSAADVVLCRLEDRASPKPVARLAAEVPTIVMAEPDQLIASVEANCRGFVPLTAPLEKVKDSIEAVLEGRAVVPPELLGTLLRHLVNRRREEVAEVDGLTPRENEVYRLAARGARKEEIAEELFISPATARTHLQRVYKKLGVHSQAELMAMATRTAAPLLEEESS